MKKHILPLIILSLFTFDSIAHTYGGSGNDRGYKVIRTADNGYALLGQFDSPFHQIYIVKLDSLARTEWTKSFGVPNADVYSGDIAQTPDGGFIIMGSEPDGAVSLMAWLLRLNGQGDTLWTKSYPYDNSAQFLSSGGYVEIVNNNEYIIGIDVEGISTPGNRSLYRTDSLGNISDTIYSTVILADVLKTTHGYLFTSSLSDGLNPYAIVLDKLDTVGTTGFLTTLFDPNLALDMSAFASAHCNSGFLTVGMTNVYTTSPSDFESYLVRTDSAGDTLWTKRGIASSTHFYGILRDSNLNYFVSGRTQQDYFIFKMDSLGDTLWTSFIGNNLTISSMLLTDNGGVALVGDSTNMVSGFTDMWFLGYDSAGNPLPDLTTGISNNISENNIGVFPNPAMNFAKIDCGDNFTDLIDGQILIDDVRGENISKQKIFQRYLDLNIRGWNTGVYFIRLADKEGRLICTKKFVVGL